MELSLPQIVDLVGQIVHLKEQGFQLIVVSSGAMAAGLDTLNFPELPKVIPAKQMLAAIGQPRLMSIYTELFGIYDVDVAQILLTLLALSDRRRYLNARNTLEALIKQGVIPIIIENDTDDSQLGLGAEVAISKQRLHARGPMALKELTTYKWVIRGNNHIRE